MQPPSTVRVAARVLSDFDGYVGEVDVPVPLTCDECARLDAGEQLDLNATWLLERLPPTSAHAGATDFADEMLQRLDLSNDGWYSYAHRLIPDHVVVRPTTPTPGRHQQQENAIMGMVLALKSDPQHLPPYVNGRPGIRSEVARRLAARRPDLFAHVGQGTHAWNRLTKAGKLRYAGKP